MISEPLHAHQSPLFREDFFVEKPERGWYPQRGRCRRFDQASTRGAICVKTMRNNSFFSQKGTGTFRRKNTGTVRRKEASPAPLPCTLPLPGRPPMGGRYGEKRRVRGGGDRQCRADEHAWEFQSHCHSCRAGVQMCQSRHPSEVLKTSEVYTWRANSSLRSPATGSSTGRIRIWRF